MRTTLRLDDEQTDEPSVDLSTAEQVSADLGLTVDGLEVTRVSEEIAEMCRRAFGLESVVETFWLEFWECPRVLSLSQKPVVEITSVTIDGAEVAADQYEVDAESGILGLTSRFRKWHGVVVVSYRGGYDLPDESPVLLQRAVAALIQYRRDQASGIGGGASSTSGVRDIIHGDTRVSFATSTTTTSSQGSGANSGPVPDSIWALIAPFMAPISI